MKFTRRLLLLSALIWSGATAQSMDGPTVADGIVMPNRPVLECIREGMLFLKKGDDGYVPGKANGKLAGYFTTAFVNEDGSRADRLLAFPARQHAYYIFTFLAYGDYTGEKEWLFRAKDLADWDIAHSTPANAFYPRLPYSAFSNGKPGGSADKDSTEPDKAAFLGSAYLAIYDKTHETKYLQAAEEIGDTLVSRQRSDGSWPFRVVPQDGTVRLDLGGAPVFYVQFFEDLITQERRPAFQKAHDNALALMLARNVKSNVWGAYHEDVRQKGAEKLSSEPVCFTATYLFRNSKKHPEYIPMGRELLRRLEEKLVHTEGHPAAPAPAVSEQEGFEHMMPGHTARYCLSLAELYTATGDQNAKKKAISGINALTYMQSDAGLFRTFFQLHNEKSRTKPYPNWYSQHLYTVRHVLEAVPLLPEISRK